MGYFKKSTSPQVKIICQLK